MQAGDTPRLLRAADRQADRSRARGFRVSSELMPGATRTSSLQERDREPLPRRARPANGYRLHGRRVRRVRHRARDRDVAARRQAHRRSRRRARVGDRSTKNGSRRSRTSIACRSTPTKQFAARDLKIAAEDLDLTLTEGIGLRRRRRPGRHRPRAARQGHASIFIPRRRPNRDRSRFSAAATSLETALRRGLHPDEPVRLRARWSTRRACRRRPVDPRELRRRAGRVPRGVAEVVRHRPRRSEPRCLDAAAGPGRFSRRDAHADASTR